LYASLQCGAAPGAHGFLRVFAFTFAPKLARAGRVRQDHRPLWVKRASAAWSRIYAQRVLYPQLDAVGEGCSFINPRYFCVNGKRIRIGARMHTMATRERPIQLTVYPDKAGTSHITFGDYCIVLPGVRIAAATGVTIGNNCMFATNSYVTDADWHDQYDRTSAPGKTATITLKDNVWIGDSAIVCKGVTIGENSIVGAGAVVTRDVPPNVVVAGNPARVVKELDASGPFKKREDLFRGSEDYDEFLARYDQYMLDSNTFYDWLRSRLLPTREH
jgi:acetyltransferase-like isoleucine patch superfamily enzyme